MIDGFFSKIAAEIEALSFPYKAGAGSFLSKLSADYSHSARKRPGCLFKNGSDSISKAYFKRILRTIFIFSLPYKRETTLWFISIWYIDIPYQECVLGIEHIQILIVGSTKEECLSNLKKTMDLLVKTRFQVKSRKECSRSNSIN
ncbi:hypothetical protein ACTFIW_003296 [Dictyostelium discoideum]